MNIDQRIKAFARLGEFFQNLGGEELQTLTEGARNQNPWFTPESVEKAFQGIEEFLTKESLTRWSAQYNFPDKEKKVAVVLAGNIPLVGFHDMLSVLLSGHKAMLKLSSKDQYLTEFIIRKLCEIEPAFKDRISIDERLKDFDAVIATGSDNTSRYFEYYFAKYPHIIRKNRTSVGILSGTETVEELQALGEDVFTYFGLGCRNVSKVFVPENYSFNRLYESWSKFESVIHHHKYCNNYDYQKSILLVNRQDFLDNGFVIIQKSERIVSPISVLYFDYYNSEAELEKKLRDVNDKIQVIVGNSKFSAVRFGQAQCPTLNDYADNIDTMKFLTELN